MDELPQLFNIFIGDMSLLDQGQMLEEIDIYDEELELISIKPVK